MVKKALLKTYRRVIQKFRTNGVSQKLHSNRFIAKLHSRIVSKLVDNHVLIDDCSFDVDSEDHMYLTTKPFEPYQVSIINKIVNPGSVVVDVGANIGVLSVLMCKKLDKYSGRIYCFEPDVRNFGLLQNNMFNNCGDKDYFLVNKAVSDFNGIMPFNMSNDNIAGSNGRGNTPNTNVDCVKLDDYLKGVKVDFVKIDVEGMEVRVLRGMKNIMRDNEDLVIMVEYFPDMIVDAGNTLKEFLFLLRDYDIFEVNEDKKKLCVFNVKKFDKLYTNLICIRKKR